MTEEELYRRVGSAAVQLFTDDFEQPEDETPLDTIRRLSGVEIGHVRRMLKAMRLHVGGDGYVAASTPQLEEIQAHLSMPITRSKQSTNSFTINNHGAGNQWQVGDEVNGSQTMTVTYTQVLESLQRQIEAASIPADQKKSLLAQLGDLVKNPFIAELAKGAVKVGTDFITNG